MNNEYGDRVDALGRPSGSPGDLPPERLKGSEEFFAAVHAGGERWAEYIARGRRRPTFVVIYDEGPRGEEDEQYYGFFGSAEEAKSQYAQLRREGYHDARVCLVVEDIPDRDTERECGCPCHAEGTTIVHHVACCDRSYEKYYPPLADEDLVADAAAEAENRWQNGRRDPESWRERGQDADEPSVTLVEKGRVIVYDQGARVDMTDEVRRSVLALTEARPLTGAVTIVVRAAQDIANQFGWLDQSEA